MTDLRFDGRVAVVTGAGNGLGRQHALELAARGAKVVVNDLGGDRAGEGASAGPAQAVVEEIVKNGGEAVANGGNVATEEGAEGIIQAALDTFGKIDIVINNAGILRDKSFRNMSAAEYDGVIAVHLRGSFLVARAAWEHLRTQGYGRIVNTSSPAGLFGNFGQANYSTAKMGLVGFTKTLGIEGKKYGIQANAIAPVAWTRMTEDLFPAAFSESFGVDKVTPLVVFLAHESNPTSGQVYTVGGGKIAKAYVAEGPGWVDKENFSVESIAANWNSINAEEPHIVPANPGEQMSKLFEDLK